LCQARQYTILLTCPCLAERESDGRSQVGEVVDALGLIGQSSSNSFFTLYKTICSGIVIVPCLQEDKVSDWIRKGIVSVLFTGVDYHRKGISLASNALAQEAKNKNDSDRTFVCCESDIRKLLVMAKVEELYIVPRQIEVSWISIYEVSELFKISSVCGTLFCASNVGYPEHT
jgi:hypothetical protein